jgi:type II secretory pathway component PulF
MNSYTVTLENYEGKCKRVNVLANDQYEAMAIAQKNGWYPVDVKATGSRQ